MFLHGEEKIIKKKKRCKLIDSVREWLLDSIIACTSDFDVSCSGDSLKS